MKSPAFARAAVFAPRAPADFADARQDICDRLLLSMMMDARTGSWFDLEQSAPQRRLDSELRRDRSQRTEPGVCAVPRGRIRLG